MKYNYLLIVLMSFIFSVKAYSQKGELVKSKIVSASADEVWERLRKLDDLEKIVPHLLSDSWVHNNAEPGIGVKRSCTAPGTPKGEASYTEEITDFSDQERFYEYAITQGTPTKNMVNTLRVLDMGYKRCLVVWTSTREAFIENPQMTEEQFNDFLNMAGQSLVEGLAKLHNE